MRVALQRAQRGRLRALRSPLPRALCNLPPRQKPPYQSLEKEESEEDSDAQLARDAIDLEASLNEAEASPMVTLVDRILLAVGEETGEMDKMLS